MSGGGWVHKSRCIGYRLHFERVPEENGLISDKAARIALLTSVHRIEHESEVHLHLHCRFKIIDDGLGDVYVGIKSLARADGGQMLDSILSSNIQVTRA